MAYFRALLIFLWLLSPVFFVLVYVRSQRASLSIRSGNARSRFAVSAVAINWLLFAALLVRSQTPYGMIFQTSILTHVFLAGSFAGVILNVRKWPLITANLALVSLWIVIGYAPAHWLRSIGPGGVKVDGRPSHATVYFGYPTDSEAEAIAFVEVSGNGDYLLSFGQEKVRTANKREYLHLPYGIWVFSSLREMSFVEPLPPKNLNQFRIASQGGRVIEVQF